ncbi:MAG: hypothetical protein NVSMB9_14220 [Isosphaeraceae bacterium]
MASSPWYRRRTLRLVFLFASILGAILGGWKWVSSRSTAQRERDSLVAIERGRAYLQEGRPALALRVVDRIPQTGRNSAEALSIKGMALAALDQPEAAQQALERSLAVLPNQPMAWKVVAATYLNANDVDRGLAALRTAARLDPADFRPWFAMGDVYDQLGRPEDAAPSYREAVLRNPQDGPSRFRLASALVATNDADEATPLLERLRDERPDDPQVAVLWARNVLSLGRKEESARFVEQALALDAENLDALVLRCQLRQSAGRHDLALKDAEHAVAIDPTSIAALHRLTLAEAALGFKDRAAVSAARRQKVLDQRSRLIKIGEEIHARPNDPELRSRLGQLAAESGATPLAVRSYRAALFLNPNYGPALQGLASLGVSPAPPLSPRSGP